MKINLYRAGGWGTARGAVQKMMSECERLQKMGVGQVIFPEGTRSKHGRLQPFKDGFFRFAVEHGTEILPCGEIAIDYDEIFISIFLHAVIHNAQKIWPMGSSLMDMGTVYFAFGEPTRPKVSLPFPLPMPDRKSTGTVEIELFCKMPMQYSVVIPLFTVIVFIGR